MTIILIKIILSSLLSAFISFFSADILNNMGYDELSNLFFALAEISIGLVIIALFALIWTY